MRTLLSRNFCGKCTRRGKKLITKTLLEARTRAAGSVRSATVAEFRISWAWALAALVAVAYGSLVPFDLLPSIYKSSLVSWVEGVRFVVAPLSDRALNLAIFVPIGVCLVLGRRAGGSVTRGALGAVVFGLAMSVALEATQTQVQSRVGSWYDVISNVTGVAIGVWIAIAARFCGERVVNCASQRLQTRLFGGIAAFVSLGLFVHGLFPFDFVTSSEELFSAFRSARWDVLGVRHARLGDPPFVPIVGQLAGAGWFVMLGYLSALANRECGRRPTLAFAAAVRHGVVLAALIEAMQLFTGSHVFDVASLLLRAIGVTFGAWSAAFVVDELTGGLWRKRPGAAAPVLLLGATLVAEIALLAVGSLGYGGWHVANVNADDVSWMPFRSLWQQAPMNAMATCLSSFLWYGPLSFAAALLLRRCRVRRSWTLATAGVLFVAVGVEVLKAGCFGRTPDATDVLLALGASVAAYRVWRVFEGMRRPGVVAQRA